MQVWKGLAGALALAALLGHASAQEKPKELGIGVFTFMSGGPAAYGMPARNAAGLIFDGINAAGGIGGVPVKPVYVDEGQGTDAVVSEFRRLATSGEVSAMIAALSSGNCLALAPIAEQLKMPTVAWNCDTHQLFLKDKYDYVYRANSSTIPEFVATALYVLDKKPDLKTVAIINPDYAFGHDAAQIFTAALKAFKPDVEFVAELFPKLGASNYNTEISRIMAARPDVVFTNFWGADLENFVRQAAPRGLFRNSQGVLSVGEAVLQSVGSQLPDGVIIGVLGDGWWQSPVAEKNAAAQKFVADYQAKFQAYPVFPSFKMANTILALKAAYEKAIAAKGGAWPTAEELSAALDGLTVETLTGGLTIRSEDNDGLVDQIVGVTAKSDKYPFPVIGEMVRYPAELVTPPAGTDPIAWIGSLDKDFLAKLPKPGSAQ
ncbi:ABC transporter substrate-binding protein [Propylenella binzhouense]|uniref:ABC transporter substrate-binding protein n=1 Tax=Propylenella binzhouense TaxID=2555902 RepID=A0A964WSY9_9HYPH|nr:ABC transporter substrate-binding protein [Propylenella binzhouense]MYZ47391.1 ABC transporter substrate-binding protein [Propylenella binzhouense]